MGQMIYGNACFDGGRLGAGRADRRGDRRQHRPGGRSCGAVQAQGAGGAAPCGPAHPDFALWRPDSPALRRDAGGGHGDLGDGSRSKHRSTSGGGKGKPKTTTYTYSTSFAVALSARRIGSIGRIWADGNLLRGSAGDFKSPITSFRVYAGSEDQALDSQIAAHRGASTTPAHRGIAYAVFQDLTLTDFGNRIPSLTFEVFADAAAVPVAGPRLRLERRADCA
jgi:hypothetical protein